MTRRIRLSSAEARRVALAAQGFDRDKPATPNDVRHYRRAMQSIGVLQLDFVNVLLPAHFLMLWSRLGGYDRDRFESFLYDSGEFLEQWAHEASIVSANDWPLLAHRRRAFKQSKNSPLNKMTNRNAYLRRVIRQVHEAGPLTSNDLPKVESPKRKPGDWHRSVPRWALEHHFGKGNLAVRRRLPNFQRVYDLPERLLDNGIREARVAKKDAQRELLRKATVSHGVATLQDLADYYRMVPREAAPRVRELLDCGDLQAVDVDGWQEPAYLSRTARIPRNIPGHSLLSPFDPLVWCRPRVLRVFGFEYRIEIYVPAAKRRWGYYVLPFRQGDRITARVDLKADRHASVLRVQSAWPEEGVVAEETATALGSELRVLANWLQLDDIHVNTVRKFEKTLSRCV